MTIPKMAPSGRDILLREPQMADLPRLMRIRWSRNSFAKALKDKAAKKAEG